MTIWRTAASLAVAAIGCVLVASGLRADQTDDALAASRAAIGTEISGGSFLDTSRHRVDLTQFHGRPLIINLIYAGCEEACPLVVESVREAVDVASESLGEENFTALTISFDTRHDTPELLAAYKRERGIDAPNWYFLTADGATVAQLASEIGFSYEDSARGFDHFNQVTLVDRDGRVATQVYGAVFDPPALVEPLKRLLMGEAAEQGGISGFIDRIRLFCTFYDESSRRYALDYSPIIMMIGGALTLSGIGFILVRAFIKDRRRSAENRPAA